MFHPRRVLAATDFSEPSRVALTMAARLAIQCHAELHVLHVEDPLLCAAARADHLDLSAQSREDLDALITGADLPSWLVTHQHVVIGKATEGICNVACRERADVVVVGATGVSGFEHVVFGSTAKGVLRRSEIPVLVVPRTWLPPSAAAIDLSGTGPLIVGVDFTVGSFQAVGAAVQLARLLGTSLELLHVIPTLPVISRWRPQSVRVEAAEGDRARQELDHLAGALGGSVAVTTRVETGPVAETLAAAARHEIGHPMLVLGRRLPLHPGDVPGSIASHAVSLAGVPTFMFMERDLPD
jgi:nucleotide-binding universal stress UspA family protein